MIVLFSGVGQKCSEIKHSPVCNKSTIVFVLLSAVEFPSGPEMSFNVLVRSDEIVLCLFVGPHTAGPSPGPAC